MVPLKLMATLMRYGMGSILWDINYRRKKSIKKREVTFVHLHFSIIFHLPYKSEIFLETQLIGTR